MWLSDLTPYPVLLPPPEISDEELRQIPALNLRQNLIDLLRTKRLPKDLLEFFTFTLARLKDEFAREMDRSEVKPLPANPKTLKTLIHLESILGEQRSWHLSQIPVTREQVYALVDRWLFLKYGRRDQPITELKGHRVVDGILEPTAGRPKKG
jgi:hypothetical protein